MSKFYYFFVSLVLDSLPLSLNSAFYRAFSFSFSFSLHHILSVFGWREPAADGRWRDGGVRGRRCDVSVQDEMATYIYFLGLMNIIPWT